MNRFFAGVGIVTAGMGIAENIHTNPLAMGWAIAAGLWCFNWFISEERTRLG
jgi:hypothetical protein